MTTKRPVAALGLCAALTLLLLWTFTALAGLAHAQGPDPDWANATRMEVLGGQSGTPPTLPGPHIAAADLVNGDFENGPGFGWTEYSDLGRSVITSSTYLPTGVTPHSNNWVAWLGGADNETAYISQTVTVPVSHTVLSFWEWIESTDFCSYNYDFATISINDTWVTSYPLCNPGTGGWVKRTLNMDAYAGQTVQLQIRIKTDVSDSSSLFIDDVALEEQSFGHSFHLPLALSGSFSCSGYNYFDGFSAPSNAWYPGVFEDVDGAIAHQYIPEGEYQIRLDGYDRSWYVTPDLGIPSGSYRVEADMRNAGGNPGTYGLQFAVQWIEVSPDDWQLEQAYQVLLNPNPDYREYLINKKEGEDWPTLRDWTYSGAIHSDPESNHLRVDRVGTSIRVYINGTAMPALTDASYTGSGLDAGIAAYSYENWPVDMRFDNFHATTCLQ